jgi:two-component system, LuxR family, response regulator FixJ
MMNEKKQIYIVDDDDSVCRALKCLLLTFGFKVLSYSSPSIFFRSVPNNEEGCLILDIHMPGMNGWETIRHLIQSRDTRPVIIITADKNGHLKQRALDAGAIGFLQKPFNDHELIELINLAF